MSRRAANRPAQYVTADEAAERVQSGMWIDYGSTFSQPDRFDRALGARASALHDVKIRACLSVSPRSVVECDPQGRHFQWHSWHFSAYDRAKHDAGVCHYIPLNLGEAPDYYRRFLNPVDIAVVRARPMDAQGCFNLSATNLWQRAVIECAKTVIVEVSDALPHVFGADNDIHVGEVDFVIKGDDSPLAELKNPAPTTIDGAVGRYIAQEIDDGACLQIGIGGMPNAVCAQLLESSVKDLGIHTEMLTDGLIALYEAGKVSGIRKALDPGKAVFTFAWGSRHLYDVIDGNTDMKICPVDYTNLPHIIMQNDRVVSINNTTQIDLQGQAASESDGHRHISGTGGQLQFVRGAYASKGGKSFICLASTYEKRGTRKSRIVLDLTPGNIVTTPRSDVMYVVTEYGIANLKGKSVFERAKALIALAHPDFREGLERQAFENRLLPRHYALQAAPDWR